MILRLNEGYENQNDLTGSWPLKQNWMRRGRRGRGCRGCPQSWGRPLRDSTPRSSERRLARPLWGITDCTCGNICQLYSFTRAFYEEQLFYSTITTVTTMWKNVLHYLNPNININMSIIFIFVLSYFLEHTFYEQNIGVENNNTIEQEDVHQVSIVNSDKSSKSVLLSAAWLLAGMQA